MCETGIVSGKSEIITVRMSASLVSRENPRRNVKSRVSVVTEILSHPHSLRRLTPRPYSTITISDRIAQRAFRKRQKAYFIDLEKEVIEKTGKIQSITKSNQSLMEMMERLQRENIAVSF
jgi:hypothetical protein